jgi:hypothetical protein
LRPLPTRSISAASGRHGAANGTYHPCQICSCVRRNSPGRTELPSFIDGKYCSHRRDSLGRVRAKFISTSRREPSRSKHDKDAIDIVSLPIDRSGQARKRSGHRSRQKRSRSRPQAAGAGPLERLPRLAVTTSRLERKDQTIRPVLAVQFFCYLISTNPT